MSAEGRASFGWKEGIRRPRRSSMSVSPESIALNLSAVRDRIERATARRGGAPGSVRLVAVTKTVGLEEVRALYDLGARHFGENRVDSALEKIRAANLPDAVWHMIGRIQRRKARDIVSAFARVDALDRDALGDELEKRCAQADLTLPVLVEVNVSGEASKAGYPADDLPAALDRLRERPHLRVEGLMTMAPFCDDPEEARPVFARLRALCDRHSLTVCSMGMSNDFEVAIEEGATEVRIGTDLFKEV